MKRVQNINYATKKDLDTVLDHHQKVILGAMSEYAEKSQKEHAELRKSLNHLTTTLDTFLKRTEATAEAKPPHAG